MSVSNEISSNPMVGLGGLSLTKYVDKEKDRHDDSYYTVYPLTNFVCGSISICIKENHTG